MSQFGVQTNRGAREFGASVRWVGAAVAVAVMALSTWSVASEPFLPEPTWVMSEDFTSSDGYAELSWEMPPGYLPELYRVSQFSPGDQQYSYVDTPRLRVFRHGSGWYDFRVQACVKDANGIPQCGGSSEKRRITFPERSTPDPDPEGWHSAVGTQTSGGPDDLRPGAWISVDELGNANRDGQGWNFYWANRMALDQTDPLFGNAYDLVGIWYTFEAKKFVMSGPGAAPGEYRPLAAELRMVKAGENSYQGDVWVTRQGQAASIGQATIMFGSGNTVATISLSNLSFKLESRPPLTDEQIVLLLGNNPNSTNNPSHYTGLWRSPQDDGLLVDHNLGNLAEVVNIVFPDDSGDPTWIQAVSTALDPGSIDFCLRYLDTGYPPDQERAGGWISGMTPSPWHDSGCDGTSTASAGNRNGGREFSNFDRNDFWVSFELPQREFATGALSVGTPNSRASLQKSANIHGIRYAIPGGSECELSPAQSACMISLSWFRSGDYPEATAFIHALGSGSRNSILPSSEAAVEAFAYTIDQEGVFEFELRMGSQKTSELIARSAQLIVTKTDDEFPPLSPDGVHATWDSVNGARFKLGWVHSDSSSVDYFEVEETTPGNPPTTNKATVPSTSPFLDLDKSAGTQEYFEYRVRACNGAGCSSYSDTLRWYKVESSPLVVWQENFESSQGWQRNPDGTDTAYRGLWEVGDPAETTSGGYLFQPGDATSGARALVTDGRAGSSIFTYDVDGGSTSMESPQVELPLGPSPILAGFNYYFSNSGSGNAGDYFRVELEHDGIRTKLLEVLGQESVQPASWTSVRVDLSRFAGQSVKFRLVAADGTDYGVAVESGMDDLVVRQFPPPNTAPRFMPPTVPPVDIALTEAEFFEIQLYAIDDEADPIEFAAVGLPPGIEIDDQTGVVSGFPALGTSEASPYEVTFSVTDTAGLYDAFSTFWQVLPGAGGSNPPEILSPGNQQGHLGAVVSLQLDFYDPDPGEVLTFQEEGLPRALAINSQTGLISGVLNDQLGTYPVVVSVSDSAGLTDQAEFGWTIVSNSTSAAPETPPSPALPPDMSPVLQSSAVGLTEGQFEVSAEGNLSYRIPLLTAPGSGGLVPELALHYSSGAGNGPVGVGWQIDGISVISRCPKTLEQDGLRGSISLDSADRFCLDGQRLLLASGNYGRNGAEYRTEVDPIARIRSHGEFGTGPAYFTVQLKDGTLHTYGNSGDSQIQAGAEVLSWARNRFEDLAGNYAVFHYQERPDPLEFVLDRVEYTGNSRAATKPYARLQFTWGTNRSDSTRAFIGGAELGISKYLTRVDSIAKRDAQSNDSYLRTYFLSYEPDGMGRKALQSVQECNNPSKQVCYRATTFEWLYSLHAHNDFHAGSSVLPENLPIFGLQVADVSGNGRPEVLYTRKAGGNYKLHIRAGDRTGQFSDWGGAYLLPKKADGTPPRVYGIDLNADSMHDVIYRKSSGSGEYRWAGRLSTGVELGPEMILSTSPFQFDDSDPTFDARVKIIDFDGDGLSDVLYNGTSALGDEHQIEFALNRWSDSGSAGFAAPVRISESFEHLFPGLVRDQDGALWETFEKAHFSEWDSVQLEGRFAPDGQVFDFNGDGAADLLFNVWREYRNCLSQCQEPEAASSRDMNALAAEANYRYSVASFWVLLSTDSSQRYQARVVGTGTRCVLPNPCETVPDVPVTDLMRAVDLNADGLADLAFTDSGHPETGMGWHFRLNTGRGFGADEDITDFPSPIPAGAESYASFVDMNGDLFPDLIYPSAMQSQSSTWRVIFNNGGMTFGAPIRTSVKAGNVGGDPQSQKIENDASIFLDFNGDGKRDHLFVDLNSQGKVGQSYIYLGRNLLSGSAGDEPSNVIVGVTNGLGAEAHFSYKPLTNGDVYTRMHDGPKADWGAGSVVYDLIAPIYVVSKVSSSAPTFASTMKQKEIEYHYIGAKVQAGGRGFLGFGEVITFDPQNGVRINTRYRQDHPFEGLPADSTRSVASNSQKADPVGNPTARTPKSWNAVTAATAAPSPSGTRVGYTINDWDAFVTGGGAEFPYVAGSLVRSYALSGALERKVLTRNGYDVTGNLTSNLIETYASDGSIPFATRSTLNTYSDNPDAWHLGRLANVNMTYMRAGQGDIIHEWSFDHDLVTGVVSQEIIEPSNGNFRVTTDYQLDVFGNRIRTTVTGQGMAPRTSEVDFDDFGRFAVEMRNDMGQVTLRINDWDGYGNTLESENIDGLLTFAAVDHMGRPFMSYTETGMSSKTVFSTSTTSCPAGTAVRSTYTGGGLPTRFECQDVLGRTIRSATQGFDGRFIYIDQYFDESGRLERVSEPYYSGAARYWNQSTYDAIGRPVALTAAGGDDQLLEYDADPDIACTAADVRVKQTTNGLGQIRVEVSNALGEIVDVYDHNCGQVRFAYDGVGNVRQVIGVDGETVAMEYDLAGRKVRISDPDKGIWRYSYNTLGEMTRQLDAKSQAIDFTYDSLGRVTSRRELSNVASLSDNTFTIINHEVTTYENSTSAYATGKGQPRSMVYRSGESGSILHQRVFAYDIFGRTEAVTSVLEGATFTESTTYDQFGRVFQQFDASGDSRGLRSHYNSRGYLSKLQEAREGTNGKVYKEVVSMDARGNASEVALGNGVHVFANYQPSSGRLQGLSAFDGVVELQNVGYLFDVLGNLRERHDQSASASMKEYFGYDELNRLEHVDLSVNGGLAGQTLALTYDPAGNIRSKSDIGTYQYDGPKPHAVSGAGGATYSYDNNGNLVSGGGRTVAYTVFDKADHITKGTNEALFSYGIGNGRYQRIDKQGGFIQKSTQYLGSVEHVQEGGNISFKRYLGDVAVATFYPATGAQSVNYLLKDHIGSIHSVLNEAKHVVATMHFSAFGERQGIDWQTGLGAGFFAPLNDITTHGFTGHEQVDDLGVIHMNGRIYDAKLGRFLQADPFVQAPENSQSLNRYTYAWNNPLSYTDPSGFFLKRLVRRWGRVIVAAVASYFTFSAAYGWASRIVGNSSLTGTLISSIAKFKLAAGAIAGAASGFVSGALLTGTARGAVKGAFAGSITLGTNKHYGNDYSLRRVIAETIGGGFNAKILGGKFREGLRLSLAVSALNYSNYRMRQVAGAVADKNPANTGKPSGGFYGDQTARAGALRTPNPEFPETSDIEFLKCDSLAGACQGRQIINPEDVVKSRIGPFTYPPYGTVDHVVESFAGPHDWFRLETGSYNAVAGLNQFRKGIGRFWDGLKNYALIPAAAPFAISGVLVTSPNLYVVSQVQTFEE